MAQTPGSNATPGLGLQLFRFASRPAPRRFGISSFATRLGQHLLVYTAILLAAMYTFLFVTMPVETGVISVPLLALAGVAVALYPTARRKPQRLLGGGVAAGYIAGAAAMLKAFESLLNRM